MEIHYHDSLVYCAVTIPTRDIDTKNKVEKLDYRYPKLNFYLALLFAVGDYSINLCGVGASLLFFCATHDENLTYSFFLLFFLFRYMTNTTKSEQTFSDTQHLSLEDRILRMAATDNSDLPEFPDDKSDLPSDFEYNPEEYDDPEEVVEEISESDMLKYLEQQEPALSVAQRLFYHELNTTESQKQSETWDLHCLTPKAVEELYSKGWTEVENIIDLSILKGSFF